MTTVETATTVSEALADVLEYLGDIDPSRIRFRPAMGTATEADVLAIHAREGRLYELVDGTLIYKSMGFQESMLEGVLIALLRDFVIP